MSSDDKNLRIRESKSRYESLKEQIGYHKKLGTFKIVNSLEKELQQLRSDMIDRLEYEIERAANNKLTGGPDSEIVRTLEEDLDKLYVEDGRGHILGRIEIDLNDPATKIDWDEIAKRNKENKQ